MYLNSKEEVVNTNINDWDYIKLKSFCTVKEMASKVKRQASG